VCVTPSALTPKIEAWIVPDLRRAPIWDGPGLHVVLTEMLSVMHDGRPSPRRVFLSHTSELRELVSAGNRVTVYDQHLSAGQPAPSPSLATQHDRPLWPSDSSI
jgi:hypothetical protein